VAASAEVAVVRRPRRIPVVLEGRDEDGSEVSTVAQNEVVCPSCGNRVPVSVGETEKECPSCGTRMDVRTTLEDAEIAEAGGEEQVTP
jgi:predicted RNA-binding Zn-ribbon protein involved in translation (DUF1610 family)